MTEEKKPIYDREFKEAAVKLCLSGQRTMKQVSDELGIPYSKLYQWIRSYRARRATEERKLKQQKDPSVLTYEDLLKKYHELELENEILKKAAAYLARTLT